MIQSRIDRLSILKELCRNRARFHAYVQPHSLLNAAEEYTFISIFDVDDRRIVLDFANDDFLARLSEFKHVLLVSTINNIRTQFTISDPEHVLWFGQNAIKADIPELLYKLQRREYYRLTIAGCAPVLCRLNTKQSGFVDLVVSDISLGGVNMVDESGSLNFTSGELVGVAHFSFGDGQSLSVQLQVCCVLDHPDALSKRIGFRFVDLDASAESRIQRYIMKISSKK